MEQERKEENPALREATALAEAGEPGDEKVDEQPAQRLPARYNLYARLNVSLRTMDIIIAVLVVLIIAALIVGIVMK